MQSKSDCLQEHLDGIHCFLHLHLLSSMHTSAAVGRVDQYGCRRPLDSFSHPHFNSSNCWHGFRHSAHFAACSCDRFICCSSAAAVGGQFSIVLDMVVKRKRLAEFTELNLDPLSYMTQTNLSICTLSLSVISTRLDNLMKTLVSCGSAVQVFLPDFFPASRELRCCVTSCKSIPEW